MSNKFDFTAEARLLCHTAAFGTELNPQLVDDLQMRVNRMRAGIRAEYSDDWEFLTKAVGCKNIDKLLFELNRQVELAENNLQVAQGEGSLGVTTHGQGDVPCIVVTSPKFEGHNLSTAELSLLASALSQKGLLGFGMCEATLLIRSAGSAFIQAPARRR